MTNVGTKNPTKMRKQLYKTPKVELIDHCGVQLKNKKAGILFIKNK